MPLAEILTTEQENGSNVSLLCRIRRLVSLLSWTGGRIWTTTDRYSHACGDH